MSRAGRNNESGGAMVLRVLLVALLTGLRAAASGGAPATTAAATAPTTSPAADKPRVVVLTDISNEPDDEESLVRLLVYSNEFDIEGLIATTSTWLKKKPREDLIRRDIEAYAQVRPNLEKHAAGFPSAEQLAASTCTGQSGYGMKLVNAGTMSTA